MNKLHLIPLSDGTLMRSMCFTRTAAAAVCILVAEGNTCRTVADLFGVSLFTVRATYRRVCEAGGIKGFRLDLPRIEETPGWRMAA